MAAVMSMEDIRTEATRLNIDLSSVDWASVRLPPGEDCGIISDDDDLHEEDSLEFDAGFGNIIIVDNLPVVPREKFEKLEGVVRKIYSQIGVIKENGLWMPVDEDTGKTRGYCFIEYNTPQENLQRWLTDEKGRDQFVIRAGSDTEVLWNDARQVKADPVYKRPFWTESFVQWSPLGTYLATVHRQGAAVKLIDFSPGEKYLVTYSSHEPSNPRDTHRVVLNIFDVRTGKVMRDFKGSADEFAIGGTGGFSGVSWPVFKWGGGKEDKYFARMGKNVISVYDTETFGLIDKKSIKVDNVMDFSWSPTDPIFALFVPELGGGNQPARVSLFQIPSKVELRQKNLFSVSDCKMYWQSNGEYLAVKVDRYTKTKKSTYTGFELFRIKERDIPIEVFELDNKNDKVISFAWEPKGHRFAVIHGDNPRPDVSFYSVKGGKVLKLTTLKQKQANALFWSPSGRFIILAGLKGFNGQLEFYNVDELETMATAEHFMATDIEWDPTGRYVATSVTSVHEMENGFNIWSFNGKLLYRILKDHFFQFLWRPRPPSFLSPEKEEEIFKNLKKYSKKYDVQDQDISVLLSEQDREKRKQLKDDWERWVNEWKRYHEQEKMDRQMLRDGEASDVEEEYEAKEVEVEELLDVSEEIIQDA
ncbi:hypothetical protein M8C21_018695 [Ambrosia artemisiifolia]|uniref:Eukaryotic translation initiation factor 3 subunit B n=1 Tax=Ambrosia artemisiifolia TaxID=4212 RepID=A0AAD5GYT7_AMBAR|nr:hypothetical protein M8C21_018695 [Ambrosia artemisiifolia]